jgi:hypothetical protein
VDTTLQLGNSTAIYDYTASDCTNYVSGRISVVFDQGTTVAITTTPFVTIGSVVGLSFAANIYYGNVNLTITTPSADWNLTFCKLVFPDLCTPCPTFLLITEDNNYLITENNYNITTECDPPPPVTTTTTTTTACPTFLMIAENNDFIITENEYNITTECDPPPITTTTTTTTI